MPTELTTFLPESLAKAQVGSQVGSRAIRYVVEQMLLEHAIFNPRRLEDLSRWKLGQAKSKGSH